MLVSLKGACKIVAGNQGNIMEFTLALSKNLFCLLKLKKFS